MHDEALAPREALESALRRSVRLQTNADLPGDCMLVMSAAKALPENTHLQALAAAERERTRGAIPACVERAVKSGELKPSADAEALAALSEGLLVGMSVQARDGVPAKVLLPADLQGADYVIQLEFRSLCYAPTADSPFSPRS